MKKFIFLILSLLNYLLPKRGKLVIFNSVPDLADSSYVLFNYLLKVKANSQYRYVWLINKTVNIRRYRSHYSAKFPDANLKFFPKKSIRGFLYFCSAKYVFYTHGGYSGVKFPKRQVIVNLWHGMPIKNVGLLEDGNESPCEFTYTIATSEFYQNIMAKIFGVSKSKVLITGLPRNEVLLEKRPFLKDLELKQAEPNKIVLWAPTYRKAIKGDIRLDGDFHGLPIVGYDFEGLNEFFKKHSSVMIVKIHQMDVLTGFDFKQYSHLVFLKDLDLLRLNLQFYDLLAEADVLLTDFSSVFVDYLILNKPIGFVANDFQAYEKNRGFIIRDLEAYLPGEMIESGEALYTFLEESLMGLDSSKEKRERLMGYYNEYTNAFSERVINCVMKG